MRLWGTGPGLANFLITLLVYWIGFNVGSNLAADEKLPIIILNTILSAATGAICATVLSSMVRAGEVNIGKTLNGMLAGLVTSSAGCAHLNPNSAILLGAIASILVYFSDWLMANRFKLNDPLSAVAVHGFAGVWGTRALALLAPIEIFAGLNRWQQLGVQSLGVAACFSWAFSLGLMTFWLLRLFNY